jgi:hypothetical protein
MNENMDSAPRDGRILVLRLADGDVVHGRYDKDVGVWTMPAGTVLIPRPVAWRPLSH